MKHSELCKIIAKQTGAEPKNKEIAAILGLTTDGVRSRAFRDKEYSFEEVKKISEFYNVQFLTENGLAWTLNEHSEVMSNYINNLAKDYASKKMNELTQGNCVRVVFRPDVYLSAGYGLEVLDEHKEYMCLDERLFYTDRGTKINPELCEIVTISGNSMSPEYRHGDRVILDKSVKEFVDGHIFAFRWQGECYIKEICLLGKRAKAVPLNKDYEPFFIEPEDDVTVFGRIVPRVRL